MRARVTLEPDTEILLRRNMAERGVSFKRALNDAIRAGIIAKSGIGPVTQVRSLGKPAVNIDGALQVAADLEDEELISRFDGVRWHRPDDLL